MITKHSLHKFSIRGYEAFILDGHMQVSVSNEKDCAEIIVKVAGDILDKKLHSLRLNMSDKIIFVSAKDSQHIMFRAEEINTNMN